MMRSNCENCGGALRLWETKCPYCHRSAVGWRHVAAVGTACAVVPLMFYVLGLFR